MSNSRHCMPRTLSCDFWIGKPGSMKRTLSLPGMRCVQAMNEPNDAATEPVVGTQERGDTSTSMKAFMKRDAAFLSSGMPSAAGYCEPMPLSRAAFSASTPYLFMGRPGEPWSILMKGMPVVCSRYWATRRTSPIVALERSFTFFSLQAWATNSSLKIFIS